MRRRIAVVVAVVALILGVGASTSTADTKPAPRASVSSSKGQHVRATPIHRVPRSTVTVLDGGAYDVDGVDLHDGVVANFDGTYYWYGSMYRCGYQWYQASPWCGFGVSTAPSLAGPWSAPTLLFPVTELDPLTGATFASECGLTDGHGCFNPRLGQRNDGVFIFWFNEVNGRQSTTTSAYWMMGCNGPAGPCGTGAGAPHGSTHKPALHQCNGNNGDFALLKDSGGGAAIVCSYGGTLAEEHLDYSWANGNGTGSNSLGGLTAAAEGPGAWQDPATGDWVMTMSDPKCGYCTGTGTGYMTAPDMMGPWTAVANVGFSAPTDARRKISGNSCGGQPRTVSVLPGQSGPVAFQMIDIWGTTSTGAASRNQTVADTVMSPLAYDPSAGTPGNGRPWIPPVSYPC